MCPEPRPWKGIPRAPQPGWNVWIRLPITWIRSGATPCWKAIQEVCVHRGWSLLAAHVRSNHVHAVVEAEVTSERVMSDFKPYGSRRLNQMRLDGPNRKRWARHGSTRWLWKPQHVSAAIQYVVAEQGDAMSVFESPDP
ncbi:MAG TPA: transposase [Candidatus Acidoferrales bacterium]|nr:transposase [Candidatus Acidoferrales bacterium]